MFSRYKKPQLEKAKRVQPVERPEEQQNSTPAPARVENPTPMARASNMPLKVRRTKSVQTDAAPEAPSENTSLTNPRADAPKAQHIKATPKVDADEKSLKRRQRLEEIKTEMHHRILDNLNLSALERANPKDLRNELVSICSEQLNEMDVVYAGTTIHVKWEAGCGCSNSEIASITNCGSG